MCFFDRDALSLCGLENNICDKGRFCYDCDASPSIVTIPTISSKARWKKFNIFDWWVKKCFWSNNNTSIGVLEAIFKEFFLTPNSLKVNNHDSKHLRFNLRWNFRWWLFRCYFLIVSFAFYFTLFEVKLKFLFL